MDQIPRPAVGIDVGRSVLHLATYDPDTRPSKWPVTILDLGTDDWHIQLSEYIPRNAIVALEPTGWYHSRPPVAWLAHTRPDVTILYVAHHQTKATRDDRVATQKTDPNDARALALKAADMSANGWTLGAHAHEESLEALNIELRLTILEYQRTVKESTVIKNRMRSYAQGIWPSLAAHFETYQRAIAAGLARPSDIQAAVAKIEALAQNSHYRHKIARYHLAKLARTLPDLPDPPEIITRTLIENYAMLEAITAKLKEIDDRITAIIMRPPIAEISRLWLTIPNASAITIAALHSATKCMADKLSPDEFRAACGCHPSRQESGQVTQAADTKRGFRPAKGLLHMWTIQLLSARISPPNPIRDYFTKLKEANNPNAIHAARGKLTRILSGIARNKTPYQYTYTAPKETLCPASSPDSEKKAPLTAT